MLDHREAKDEMRRLFDTRFKNLAVNGLPNSDPPVPPLSLTKRNSYDIYIPEIRWQNVEKRDLNDNGVHWLRFVAQNIQKQQRSLAGGREEAVGTSYTTRGFIRVELYFSRSAYQTEDQDTMSAIVERCFIQQNTAGGVWFRNTVIVDMEPEENHFRSNVLTEYEYDSVIK